MPSQKMETQFATNATEGRKSARGCRTLTVNQDPGGRQRSTESIHLQLTAENQNCYNCFLGLWCQSICQERKFTVYMQIQRNPA